jgi:hypothetical protein
MLAVCPISVVVEDLVSEYPLAAAREPRMPAFDRLFHVQTGVQAQILRDRLRSLYGIFLRITARRGHEQTVPVHTRRVKPRAAYSRGPEEREFE